jgi:hypothetical protein
MQTSCLSCSSRFEFFCSFPETLAAATGRALDSMVHTVRLFRSDHATWY